MIAFGDRRKIIYNHSNAVDLTVKTLLKSSRGSSCQLHWDAGKQNSVCE